MSMPPKLKDTLLTVAVILPLALVICVLTAAVASLFGITLNEQTTLAMIKNARGWQLVKLLGWVIVAAPVAEEFAFRFLLFRGPLWLSRACIPRVRSSPRLFSRLAATFAAISSALFVAAHYGALNPFPDDAFIALFVFALAHCRLYMRTSRFWCTVLSHSLFNCANLAILFSLPEGWLGIK